MRLVLNIFEREIKSPIGPPLFQQLSSLPMSDKRCAKTKLLENLGERAEFNDGELAGVRNNGRNA